MRTNDVWVAIIDTVDGPAITAHLTSEGARAEIYQWVKDFWTQEMDEEKMPANPDQAVERYFEEMGDRSGRAESYEIKRARLKP